MRAPVNQDFDTANEFVAAYNKARLQNKNQWIYYLGNVAGKEVRIKSYDTTNQILDVDGIRHGGTYDLSVAQWKTEILKAIEYRDPVRRNPARRNITRNPVDHLAGPTIDAESGKKFKKTLSGFYPTAFSIRKRDGTYVATVSLNFESKILISWKKESTTDRFLKTLENNLKISAISFRREDRNNRVEIETGTNDLLKLIAVIAKSMPKFVIHQSQNLSTISFAIENKDMAQWIWSP